MFGGRAWFGGVDRHAVGASWSILLHGDIRGQGEISNAPNESDHHAKTPSSFPVADRMPQYRVTDGTFIINLEIGLCGTSACGCWFGA